MKKKLVIAGLIALVLAVVIGSTVFAGSSYESKHITSTGIITVSNVPASGGGGGGAPHPVNIGYIPNINGTVIDEVTATSVSTDASLVIETGTIALDKDGYALRFVKIDALVEAPPLPEGSNIVGIPYEFTPNGATFNPAITITFKYDTADMPEDSTLAIVFWNGSEWVELTDITVDPVSGTVNGKTTHFTKFALISVLKPVATTTTPVITPTVTPDETTTPEPTETTPAVTETTTPTVTVTPDKPTETVTTSLTPTQTDVPVKDNKAYIWVIIGVGIILVVSVTVLIIRKNRK